MNGNEKKPVKKPLIFYYLIVLVVLMLLNWLIVPSVMERSIQKTSYREFLDSIENKEIKEVELESDVIYYTLEKDGEVTVCKTGRIDDENLVERPLELNFRMLPEKMRQRNY